MNADSNVEKRCQNAIKREPVVKRIGSNAPLLWKKRSTSKKAIDAFKQGHADGRGVVKVDYLKEEHPPVKGGDKLMR